MPLLRFKEASFSEIAQALSTRLLSPMLRPFSSAAPLQSLQRVLVLSGPTATGKSAIAVEIARRLGGEIVSADSVQLYVLLLKTFASSIVLLYNTLCRYKRLDIGSGKVTSSEMHGVPHHCIDVFEPSDDIGANNAAQFCALARSCIDDIIMRGATPIVVGGSGMYLSFLLYGSPSTGVTTPSTSPPSPRPQSPSSAASTDMVAEPPSRSSRSPHSNDAYRIKRRRDIEAASGSVPVYPGLLPHRHLLPLDYNFVCVSLWCERAASFRRIDRRVERMVCDGLLVEVLRLYGSGCLRASSMAARAIGYRHALQFLAEHQTALLRDDWIEEFDSSSAVADQRPRPRLAASNAMHDALLQFISRMQAATRQYSTRQLTWFKGDKRWLWFDTQPVDGSVDVGACADRLLKALASDPPTTSTVFAPTLPPLTKAEVTLIY